MYLNKSQTYTVASAPAMKGSGFYAEFQIVFGIVHSPLDELQYDCKKSKGTRTRFESFSSWKTMFWHNNVLRHGVRGKKLFRSIKWSLRLYDSFFGG